MSGFWGFVLGTGAGIGVGYLVWGRPRENSFMLQGPNGSSVTFTAPVQPAGALTGTPVRALPPTTVSSATPVMALPPQGTPVSLPMRPDPAWRTQLQQYVFVPTVTVRTFTNPTYGARLVYNSAADQDALRAKYGFRPDPRNVWLRQGLDGQATLVLVGPKETFWYQAKSDYERDLILDLLVKQAKAELVTEAATAASQGEMTRC